MHWHLVPYIEAAHKTILVIEVFEVFPVNGKRFVFDFFFGADAGSTIGVDDFTIQFGGVVSKV